MRTKTGRLSTELQRLLDYHPQTEEEQSIKNSILSEIRRRLERQYEPGIAVIQTGQDTTSDKGAEALIETGTGRNPLIAEYSDDALSAVLQRAGPQSFTKQEGLNIPRWV